MFIGVTRVTGRHRHRCTVVIRSLLYNSYIYILKGGGLTYGVCKSNRLYVVVDKVIGSTIETRRYETKKCVHVLCLDEKDLNLIGRNVFGYKRSKDSL